MAASTITRTTWTNDSGTPASPAGDGTLINNARLQDIYAAIDEMFSGSGSYATLTIAGKLAVEGFGSHTFSAGGTGANIVAVRNTTAGTGNYAEVRVGNDTSASALVIDVLSSTYTGSNNVAQMLNTLGSAFKIGGTNASGTVEFLTNATTRLTISASGVFTFGAGTSVSLVPVADGSVSAPSLSFSGDADTGFYRVASNVIGVAVGGVKGYEFGVIGASTSRAFTMPEGAFGTGAVSGAGVFIGRNSSGSGAAGFIQLTDKNGSAGNYWQDATGNLRVHTAAPLESSGDTSGTVVGTQTSLRATKRAISDFLDHAGALDLIRRTPLYRFQYRAFDPETRHVGIMADESPEFVRYGGTAFDPINAFGYTAAAIKALIGRVESLEAALAAGRQG